jgi:hypothetical protein
MYKVKVPKPAVQPARGCYIYEGRKPTDKRVLMPVTEVGPTGETVTIYTTEPKPTPT